MQNRNNIQEWLYNNSMRGKRFKNITRMCFDDQNILTAYYEVSNSIGYKTCGVDGLTIDHISKYSIAYIVNHVKNIVFSTKGYTPKPVKIKQVYDITGEMKIIAIPCIWDRIIQQCIKRIIEPICEARFSNNSYGSRVNRTIEHAIGKLNRIINQSHSYYIISVEFNNFYSEVNHKKFMRQLWSIGLQDKHLLWLINRMLKSAIRTVDNNDIYCKHGIYQCGILYPLFGNIVLNELDHRIDKMWCDHHIINNFSCPIKNGIKNKTSAYISMKNYTNLVQVRFVRYNDKIKILCNDKEEAQRLFIGISKWIKNRLHISINENRTILANIRKRNIEFLGFAIKAIIKGNGIKKDRLIVKSSISVKSILHQKHKLKGLIKNIQTPRSTKTKVQEVSLYNRNVCEIHKYYRIATCVGLGCRTLSHYVNCILINRLKCRRSKSLSKTIQENGFSNNNANTINYLKSNQCRYLKSMGGQIIYPIGYIRTKPPMQLKRIDNPYTDTELNYRNSLKILHRLYHVGLYNRSAEYVINRAKLYELQSGKCEILNTPFINIKDIHCHHIIPRNKGGLDRITNLVLIDKRIHYILHITDPKKALSYINKHNLNLTLTQLKKINQYRLKLQCSPISL